MGFSVSEIKSRGALPPQESELEDTETFSISEIKGRQESTKKPIFKLSQDKPHDFSSGVVNSGKAVLDFLGEASIGMQETLADLTGLLNLDFAKPEEERFLTEIKKNIPGFEKELTRPEKVARFVGGIATPVPGAAVTKAPSALAPVLSNQAKIALSNPQVQNLTGKITDISRKTLTPAQTVMDTIGKIAVGVKGKGYNDRVKTFLKETPEAVFQPKENWSAVQKEALNAVKENRTTIGKKVEFLKDRAAKMGIDTSEINEELRALETIKDSIKGKKEKQFVDLMMNSITSGGKIIKKAPLKKQKALQLKRVNQGDMDSAVEAIQNDKAFISLLNRSKKEALTTDEGKVISAFDVVKQKSRDMLDSIDDKALAKGLINAKGEYKNFMNAGRIIGGPKMRMNQGSLAKKITNSLEHDNESVFDALDIVLGPDLKRKAVGIGLNRDVGKTWRFDPLAIAQGTVGKTGGVLAATKAPSDLRIIPKSLIRTRKAATAVADLPTRALGGALQASIKTAQQFPKELVPPGPAFIGAQTGGVLESLLGGER